LKLKIKSSRKKTFVTYVSIFYFFCHCCVYSHVLDETHFTFETSRTVKCVYIQYIYTPKRARLYPARRYNNKPTRCISRYIFYSKNIGYCPVEKVFCTFWPRKMPFIRLSYFAHHIYRSPLYYSEPLKPLYYIFHSNISMIRIIYEILLDSISTIPVDTSV